MSDKRYIPTPALIASFIIPLYVKHDQSVVRRQEVFTVVDGDLTVVMVPGDGVSRRTARRTVEVNGIALDVDVVLVSVHWKKGDNKMMILLEFPFFNGFSKSIIMRYISPQKEQNFVTKETQRVHKSGWKHVIMIRI